MRKLSMALLIAPVMLLSSFFYPYMGGMRGLDGNFTSSVDFTMNEFIGFGYDMDAYVNYSDFLGTWAFNVNLDAKKSGKSLYRLEDGSIVEYRFPFGEGWKFSGNIGVGTGDRMIYGADIVFEKSDSGLSFGLFPAVGFKPSSFIISAFAGVDSNLTIYTGLRYISDWTDSSLYGTLGKEFFVNLVSNSKYFDISLKYSPDEGDLFVDADLKLFGVVLGGHIEITDRLDYYLLAGISLGFGKQKPEQWYINEVLKQYAQKNYQNSYDLVKEGIKLYPNSLKLKKYFTMVEREYLSSRMLAMLSSGNIPEARKIASELLKKYQFDPVVLKRCVNLSEKTALNPQSYAYTGLSGDDLKKFSDAIFHYLSGDYSYALRTLSELLIKHEDNDYLKVKIAEVFAAQGAWKNALKMLDRVKKKVVGYSYSHALALLKKGSPSIGEFLKVFKEGDIDHIRDSLFYSLYVSVKIKNYKNAEIYGTLLSSIGYGKYELEGSYYLGIALMNLHKYQQAVDYLTEAVGAYENTPKSDITPEKKKIYEDAIKKTIKSYEVLAKKRLEYYLSAADYVAKLISITTDPKKRFELVKKKALYLYKGHDYENALYEFEDLMSKDKTFEKYYNASMARQLFAKLIRRIIQQSFPVSLLKDDFEKVVKSYEKVLKEDPSILDEEDYLNIAYSANVVGNFKLAGEAISKLEKMGLKDKAKVFKAYMEFLMGKLSDAEKDLKSVNIKKAKDFYQAMYYKIMGRIRYAKKDYQGTVKYLEVFFTKYMGMGMDSDDILAISDAYIKLKKPEKVLDIVSEEKLGSSPGLYLIRAQALMSVGQYEDAFKTLEDLAESPMMNNLSNDLKVQAFKMMGTLAFETGNYWKAKEYFEKAFGYAGKQAKDVKDRFTLSDILIRKVSGSEISEKELEDLTKSDDKNVRIIASVELSDLYFLKGNNERALKILKNLKTDDKKLKSFIDYEIAKISLDNKDYKEAIKRFLSVWNYTKNRKVLRKVFSVAIHAKELDEVYKYAKSFINDPLLGDMARFIISERDGKISIFMRPSSFLSFAIFYKAIGKFDEVKQTLENFYKSDDEYGKMFISSVFNYLGETLEFTLLKDKSDPIAEYVRNEILGTLKKIENYSLERKPNSELEWQYEHKASKYILYEVTSSSEKKLQSSRRRRYKLKLDEGFHVMRIEAKKSIGAGAYIKDYTPPFVIKVTENLSPKVEWAFPSDGNKTYVKFKLLWKSSDPEKDEVFYNVYYGKDLKSLKKLTTSGNDLRLSLPKGNYIWFVEAIDSNENIGFSPMAKILVSDQIELSRNWKVMIGKSYAQKIAQVGDYIVTTSSGGRLSIVDKNGKIVANPKIDAYVPMDLVGTFEGNIIYTTYSKVVDMDSSGKVVWSDDVNVKSNIAADKVGNIYYAANGQMIARNKSGNILWQFPPAGFFKIDVKKIIPTNKWVVILSPTNGWWVIWIDLKGNNKWQIKVSQDDSVQDMIIDNQGRVFVLTKSGILMALKDGNILWKTTILSEPSGPLVEFKDKLYLMVGGDVLAISKENGSTQWKRSFSESHYFSSKGTMVIGENGEMYILIPTGTAVRVMDDNGNILSTYNLSDDPGDDMIMGTDGNIYIITRSGFVLSLSGASFSSPKGWNQQLSNSFRNSYIGIGGD